MPPKTKQTQVVDAVQAEIKAYLAPLGFKCKGRNFNRKIGDDLTQVVNIWMGPYTSTVHGLISINLGVYHPGIDEILHPARFKDLKWVAELHCFIRKRLGQNGHSDRWWEPNPGSTTEIIRLLRLEEASFFDRYSTLEQILAELYAKPSFFSDFQTPPRILAAAVRLMQGEQVEAARLLREQAESTRATNPWHADYVLELAQRLGLSDLKA
jgi:hypothetical protein